VGVGISRRGGYKERWRRVNVVEILCMKMGNEAIPGMGEKWDKEE
jgi:hypothetical protein